MWMGLLGTSVVLTKPGVGRLRVRRAPWRLWRVEMDFLGEGYENPVTVPLLLASVILDAASPEEALAEVRALSAAVQRNS